MVGVNKATVYPRELGRQVYQNNDCGVILTHNYPLGIAKPSEKPTKGLHKKLSLF